MKETKPLAMNNKDKSIYIVVTFLLFCWYYLAYFHSDLGKYFQVDFEKLVVDGLLAQMRGDYNYGGFMVIGGHYPYTAQFALQFKILNLFLPIDPEGSLLAQFIQNAKLILLLLFSGTMALYVCAINKEFGKFSASILFLSLCFSYWLIGFSPNLYWVIFTSFLPFVFCWAFYKNFQQKEWILYWGVGGLLFIKSLCGYEYITNILLSLLVPVIYYEMLKAHPLENIKNKGGKILLSGLIGFIGAIVLHFIQSLIYSHALSIAALQVFSSFNVLGGTLLATDAELFHSYFAGPAVIPFFPFQSMYWISHLFLFLLSGLCFYFVFYVVPIDKAFSQKQKTLTALGMATLVAYVASFSWVVLALTHMHDHLYTNQIIFYIPLHLVLFVFIPFCAQAVFEAKLKEPAKKRFRLYIDKARRYLATSEPHQF